MLVYPYLAHSLLSTSETIGLFLGTAVHDTSQVVGAALTYKQVYADDVVLRVATVTKLTRNIFLAAVIPLLTWMHMRSRPRGSASGGIGGVITTLVPGFVVGFLAMAIVRSIGDATLASTGAAFGVFSAESWASMTKDLGDFWASQVLLGTAMAAVGLNTNFAVFKGVGLKPFASAWPARWSSAPSAWGWQCCLGDSCASERNQPQRHRGTEKTSGSRAALRAASRMNHRDKMSLALLPVDSFFAVIHPTCGRPEAGPASLQSLSLCVSVAFQSTKRFRPSFRTGLPKLSSRPFFRSGQSHVGQHLGVEDAVVCRHALHFDDDFVLDDEVGVEFAEEFGRGKRLRSASLAIRIACL